MADLKFDGSFFHCSQCGAFSTTRAGVVCDCLGGTKAFGGDAPVLEVFDPMVDGWGADARHRQWEAWKRESDREWERAMVEQRRRAAAHASAVQQLSDGLACCPCVPLVRW